MLVVQCLQHTMHDSTVSAGLVSTVQCVQLHNAAHHGQNLVAAEQQVHAVQSAMSAAAAAYAAAAATACSVMPPHVERLMLTPM
jgi:hypothetical protein